MPGAGDGTIEVIGVGSAIAGKIHTGLCPCHRIGAVGMDDAPDVGKCLVKLDVRLGVAAGIQGSLYNVALQIQNHHPIRGQVFILHAAWLDDHQAGFPVDSRHIPPGKNDQIPPGQIHIGFINLFLQFFKHHSFSLCRGNDTVRRRAVTNRTAPRTHWLSALPTYFSFHARSFRNSSFSRASTVVSLVM